ncbi:hypothetical protein scyTo_0024768 [Scyliorhinus torazame]|uniref:Uncharacterized protein n=1 Tax=Scyliorhinus torazame TaxID=75743 RepID=A0A401QFA1_SCYTO|nr:hypothetical protein [Scyliorhinus torazame]
MLKDRKSVDYYEIKKKNACMSSNAAFTDLAEIVSRIEPSKSYIVPDGVNVVWVLAVDPLQRCVLRVSYAATE